MREGAQGIADGSAEHPYPGIIEAIAAAGEDGWVLVTDGHYVGTIRPEGSVHIVGRCAARVVVAGDSGLDGTTLDARFAGQNVDVRGVSIRGPGTGVTVRNGAVVRLDRVEVRGTRAVGILAEGVGTRVETADAWIHATSAETDGSRGDGVYLGNGAALTGDGVAITSNLGMGVVTVGAGSHIAMHDSVIRDTGEISPMTPGGGLYVTSGASATLERCVLDGNTSFGAHVFGRATLTDSIIRNTRSGQAGSPGYGLLVRAGGRLTAERVLVERNAHVGVAATGTGGVLEVSRSVIRATVAPDSGSAGAGLFASSGSNSTLDGCVLEDNDVASVFASDLSEVTITNGVVRRTLPGRSGMIGRSLTIQSGSRVTATRFSLEDSFDSGAAVFGAGTFLRLEDGVVRDVRAAPGVPPEQSNGFGILVAAGARAVLSRVRVSRAVSVGIEVIDPGTTAALVDSVVEDTASRGSLPDGAGLFASGPARIEVSGSRFERNRGAGLKAQDRASIDVTDSLVAETRATPDGFTGYGLNTSGGATIAARRILVTDNRECGVYAANPSTITISDSVVRRTQPRAHEGRVGVGLAAERGGRLVAVRVLAAENREVGVLSRDPGSFASFDDGAVIDMIPNDDPRGIDGGSVQAYYGGVLEVRNSLIAGGRMIAVNVFGDRATMLLADSAIRDTRATLNGVLGFGLSSAFGGTLTARRVVIAGTREGGGGVQGSRLNLEDVIVMNSAPTARGFGIGLAAAAGGALEGERVAIVDVHGAALGSVRTGFAGPSQPSRVSVRDLFVRNVQPSILTSNAADPDHGAGERVGYALFAAPACLLDVSRGVIDNAQYGLFSDDGVVTWRTGVVTHQTRSAVSAATTESIEMLAISDVLRVANLQNDTSVDPSLPELRLPPPARPCLDPPACSR